MMKKIVLAIAVAAFATAFAPTASYAKKAKAKTATCKTGTLVAGHANQWNWAPVSACGFDGKFYPTLTSCYVPSGLCPK